MNKFKISVVGLLSLLLLGLVFQKQLTTHGKILLFISEQFPQIPTKPLGLVTKESVRQQLELNSVNGSVVADLFYPARSPSDGRPALIIAMGIKTADKDKPVILHLAQTLARLGYVVIWPRLKVLDQGQSLPEEPATFVEAFKYLSNVKDVNPQRISFIGFSVGSSTALVAASDEKIREQVHGLIFFGGYYDVVDYLVSLATKSYLADGQVVDWQPDQEAQNHARGLLEAKGAGVLTKVFETGDREQWQLMLPALPTDRRQELLKYSPAEYLQNFAAPIFILHDRSDRFVPYVESVKLKHALPQKQVKGYLLVDLFEHVQPKQGLSVEIIGEFVRLYSFLYQVFILL